MAKLTIDQDMKLSSALDQLEDAIEAAYASLKMVYWAQLNVARFAGGTIDSSLNTEIRSVPLEIEHLWRLAQSHRQQPDDETNLVYAFADNHNKKILDIIDDFDN
jgi:hypothetical protein